jgi:M6 family metalloprotease-like protein
MGIFMKPKQLLTLVSLFGVVLFSCKKTTSAASALCSCPSSTPSVTSPTTSSSPSASSASASVSASVSASETKASALTLTLAKTELKTGNNFLTTAVPSLDYVVGGIHFDPQEDQNYLSWVIKDSHETLASPDTALTAGTYSVTAVYNGVSSNTLTFTVSDWDHVDTAKGISHPVTDFGAMTLDKMSTIATFLGSFPSIGTPKMLVVPVDFSDNIGTEQDREAIQKAYTGTDGETGWKSVHDYYYESSYHKLNISVTPWFRYGRTTENQDGKSSADLEKATGTNSKIAAFNQTWDILKDLTTWLVAQNYNLADYDYDKDGYVDGIEMVYKYSGTNKENGGNALWWSYTYVYGQNQQLGTATAPVIFQYCWFLFSSIENGYYSPNIDAHTVIHETGHLLGLRDYYDQNESSFVDGGAAMMDFSIGDHDAYSKMALNWITPDVLDGTSSHFTYTLKPFEENGTCLLVRNTSTDPWNENPFDEYLLLQYYTPTGLNQSDSQGYARLTNPFFGHGGTYASAGLQVFHVDSRMFTDDGTFQDEEILTANYHYTDSYRTVTTDTSVTPNEFHDIVLLANSNTTGMSYNVDSASITGELVRGSKNRQIKMIPSYSKNVTDEFQDFQGILGMQANLFEPKEGQDYFSFAHQRAYFKNSRAFNDQSVLGYSFKVTAMDTAGITLEFFAD